MNLLHCEKICLCRTGCRGRQPLPTDRLHLYHCCIKNSSKAKQALRKPIADPAFIRLRRIFALLLRSVSCFRDGYYTVQKFDSVATRHSLRMTLGGDTAGASPRPTYISHVARNDTRARQQQRITRKPLRRKGFLTLFRILHFAFCILVRVKHANKILSGVRLLARGDLLGGACGHQRAATVTALGT